MKTSAVILSGGRGSRMKSETPKQYLTLCGYPVIYYALRTFEKSSVDEIVLVCGRGDREYCQKEIIEKYGFRKVIAVTEGGKERYHSVCQGLRACREPDLVLIHDGARPLLTVSLIEQCMKAVREGCGCVPGLPVKDTIKMVGADGMVKETPDRKALYAVQTPQAFPYPLIRKAYEKLLSMGDKEQQSLGITDDAMAAEKLLCCPVRVIEGDHENLKITTPEDLVIAERILRTRDE